MKSKSIVTTTVMLSALFTAPASFGYSKSRAEEDCVNKINAQWGYKHADAENVSKLGNGNFVITGKVKSKEDKQMHHFSCNIRHREVSSWYINPKGVGDDHKNSDKAAAVGAGLLAIAAVAAIANKDKDDDYYDSVNNPFDDISRLKKACRKDIRRHLRHDHGKVDDLELRNVHLNHRTLSGKGRVSFRDDTRHRLSFSCDFDRRGNVVDGHYFYKDGGNSNAGNNGVPEIVARSSGEIEVRMPSGCTALYDARGELITRGSSCSKKDRRKANDAAKRYFREQGQGD